MLRIRYCLYSVEKMFIKASLPESFRGYLSYFYRSNTNFEVTLKTSTLHIEDKRIIVVEDDLPSIRYYETLLKSTGADIKIFRTGKESVDYINSENEGIDLVFMDFLI